MEPPEGIELSSVGYKSTALPLSYGGILKNGAV